MSIAITEAITTLAEAEQQFNLLRTEDETFFSEWQTSLPDLSMVEQTALDQLRRRYLYQRSEGQLLEGTVTLLLASPLLAIAGFYDPPFRVRAEASVQLTLDDGEEVLQGRIDVLVLAIAATLCSITSVCPTYLQSRTAKRFADFETPWSGDGRGCRIGDRTTS